VVDDGSDFVPSVDEFSDVSNAFFFVLSYSVRVLASESAKPEQVYQEQIGVLFALLVGGMPDGIGERAREVRGFLLRLQILPLLVVVVVVYF